MVAWIQNSTLYVGIDASRTSFQLYEGGNDIYSVFDDKSCSYHLISKVFTMIHLAQKQ